MCRSQKCQFHKIPAFLKGEEASFDEILENVKQRALCRQLGAEGGGVFAAAGEEEGGRNTSTGVFTREEVEPVDGFTSEKGIGT